MGHYRFITEWQADAPAEQVWDVLLDYRRWPTWWRGFRSVEQLAPGDPSGRGMRIRQAWRSLIPYTLTFDLEILGLQRPGLVRGRASGAVEGDCTWTLEEQAGRTTVRFLMDVRTTRWWMNLPLPLAGRIFAWNYDAIMRWGAEGMTRAMGRPVVDATAELRLAGA
jgi:hypothetical protein